MAQLVHWGDVEPVTSRQVRDVGDAAVVSPPGSVRDAWRITRITQARMASLTSRIVRFLSRAASCGARPADPTSRRCHRAIRRPRQRAAIASSGAAVRGASRAHFGKCQRVCDSRCENSIGGSRQRARARGARAVAHRLVGSAARCPPRGRDRRPACDPRPLHGDRGRAGQPHPQRDRRAGERRHGHGPHRHLGWTTDPASRRSFRGCIFEPFFTTQGKGKAGTGSVSPWSTLIRGTGTRLRAHLRPVRQTPLVSRGVIFATMAHIASPRGSRPSCALARPSPSMLPARPARAEGCTSAGVLALGSPRR